jgi:membrane associated rhomboid family serine protease
VVPLRDNNPTFITPYITYLLIAANIAVFGLELSLSKPALDQFFSVWAVVPVQLTESFNQTGTAPIPEWVTLFSSQFLHGGFLHIAGNMLFLWIFGNNVEEQLGHIRYLVFYLACGALAALSQWYISAYSPVPSLGASGAIAGVMGAYILRFPGAKITTLIPLGFLFWTADIPAFFFIGFWFLQQAFSGLASLDVPSSVGMVEGGIAYFAHAGGFIAGAILGPIMGLFTRSTYGRR